MSLCVKGVGAGTSAPVGTSPCACVCECDCTDAAVCAPAQVQVYVRVRVSLYKDVDVDLSVVACAPLLLLQPPALSAKGPPPALLLSRPPRGLNPATHRGGGSGCGFSPRPTHLGPVATPRRQAGLGAGKAPSRPPGGGNSHDVSVRRASRPFSLAESLTLDWRSQPGATRARP